MNIKIVLENLDCALNCFNDEMLSNELDDYIINSCQHKFFNKKTITLNIYNFKDKEKQEKLKDIIHSYYKNKVHFFNKIDKIDDYFHLILMIVGIVAIILSEKIVSLLSELFLIAGWVVIWEILYDIIFNDIKRRRTIRIYKELARCKINFL